MVILNSSDSNATLVSLGREQQPSQQNLQQLNKPNVLPNHHSSSRYNKKKRSKPNGGLTPMRRVGSLELLQQAAVTSQQESAAWQEPEPVEFEATHLYLPSDYYNEDDEFVQNDSHVWKAHQPSLPDSESDSEESFFSCESTKPQEPLYLPKLTSSSSNGQKQQQQPRMTVDECFSHLPCLREASDSLLAQSTQEYNINLNSSINNNNNNKKSKLLYVGQSEVGHCVPLQADVIVSDRATTCHILMLYSVSSGNVPLATCAHLDSTRYNIAELFDAHLQHHQRRNRSTQDIELDIHIVGGYTPEQHQPQQQSSLQGVGDCDATATSRKLTQWIVYELAQQAQRCAEPMTCTLQTALVSQLNTSNHHHHHHHSHHHHHHYDDDDDGARPGQPLARGLALHTKTGRVWMAHVQNPTQSQPQLIRRQAQLWFRQQEQPPSSQPEQVEASTGPASVQKQPTSLTVIHSATQPTLVVPETTVPLFPQELLQLRNLPDAVLLHYTSTSPLCEEDDFCDSVRRTIDFWQEHAGQTLPAEAYKRHQGDLWRQVVVPSL